MTHGHTATAAYDHQTRGVGISIDAATIAAALAGDDEHLGRLSDAIDESSYRHTEALQLPTGPIRDFARQEAEDAFAAQLGAVTVTLTTTAALQLADQVLGAVRSDPRIAEHPYLVELADCAVRRLLGIHQLLSGTTATVQIPAVPA